jgi:hypothetical protein
MGPVCLTSEMHEINIVSHTVWVFPRTQAANRGFARLFPRTHGMVHKDRRLWGHSHPTSGSRNKIFVKRLTVLTCVLLCKRLFFTFTAVSCERFVFASKALPSMYCGSWLVSNIAAWYGCEHCDSFIAGFGPR